MQANKNGFFYALDGATGELLRAQAFTQVNWADGVDMTTRRPRVRPEARYAAGQDFNGIPGPQGARGWHPGAFSPQTGLLYIPTQEAYFAWVHDPAYLPSDTGYNLGIDLNGGTYYQTHPTAPRGFVSSLQAWDPTTGTRIWSGETNVGPTGGALATAGGLVFQGGGSSQEFRLRRRHRHETLEHASPHRCLRRPDQLRGRRPPIHRRDRRQRRVEPFSAQPVARAGVRA